MVSHIHPAGEEDAVNLFYGTTARTVVLQLLDQAHDHAANGEGTHADSFFRAAVAADETPISTIEFGCFLAVIGKTEDALLRLHAGWEGAKCLKSPELRALACHNLAALYRDLGDTLSAQQYQQLALAAELDFAHDEYENSVNGTPLSSGCVSEAALFSTALDQIINGEQKAGIECLKRLSSQSCDDQTRVTAFLNLASIRLAQGHPDAARRFAADAFSLAKESRNAPLVLRVLEQLVKLFSLDGSWLQAEQCATDAVQLSRSIGDHQREAEMTSCQQRLTHALGILQSDPQLN